MASELDQTRDANEKKWKIEDAARTLQRSEEIRADNKLFNAARKELKKRHDLLVKIINKLGGK